MSDIFDAHLQRLKAGANQATAIRETSKWIATNTMLRGKPYSFKDHEYQLKILDSEAQEVNVRKCSQVGITEVSVRKALAMCGMIKNFTTIYTFPTAAFAATIAKTRVDPIIRESPFLSQLMTDIDNVDVKQLSTSFLFLKGSASSNAPISTPADFLIHDELDFSDENTISQYQSRISHSKWKLKWKFSTPTIPGKGVDFEFQRSRRNYMFVKCSCCGHYFIPDYYEHVRIPGATIDLHDITKRNLHEFNYRAAFVECPSCGGQPDMNIEHREWVCENPTEHHVAEGIQVTPFDAPNIVTPGYLVEASTQYSNIADFVNFGLGLPYYSQESVLSPEEVQACIVPSKFEGLVAHVMGVDLGKICHIVVVAISYDGAMQAVHLEKVPLQQLKQRYFELRAQYRVRVSVIDSLPYTDTVLALQAGDQNLWASVYVQTRGTELFTVKKRDEVEERGVQALRQINVNRDRTFDSLMPYLRSGQFSKVSCPLDGEFVQHCTDMRRVKDWNSRSQQIEFKWVKSEMGDDHFWFALSYAYLAQHIVGTFTGGGGMGLPLISSFKLHDS